MREIPLTQGRVALVDDEDYDTVSQFRWYSQRDNHTFYARRNLPRDSGPQRKESLHRFLLNPKEGEQVDHVDGDGLNNTRVNLRIATHSQQMRNRRMSGRTGYKGVTKDARWGTFVARIDFDKKRRNLGSFKDAVTAARAYDKAALELHGEFAVLNFPEGESM